MKLIQEFKQFTFRGNVLDLAVGIVIGAAFGAIVNAVVETMLMPIIGMLTGGIDFKALSVKVGDAELRYGMLIQASITFLIIAFFPFLIVKAANSVRLNTPVAPPSNSEQLLAKIYTELSAIRTELNRESLQNKDVSMSARQ